MPPYTKTMKYTGFILMISGYETYLAAHCWIHCNRITVRDYLNLIIWINQSALSSPEKLYTHVGEGIEIGPLLIFMSIIFALNKNAERLNIVCFYL